MALELAFLRSLRDPGVRIGPAVVKPLLRMAGKTSVVVKIRQVDTDVLESVPVLSIDTASGRWVALGYYTVPKAGNLLDGPTSTSPVMTVAICGTDCQGYTFLALANGDRILGGRLGYHNADFSKEMNVIVAHFLPAVCHPRPHSLRTKGRPSATTAPLARETRPNVVAPLGITHSSTSSCRISRAPQPPLTLGYTWLALVLRPCRRTSLRYHGPPSSLTPLADRTELLLWDLRSHMERRSH